MIVARSGLSLTYASKVTMEKSPLAKLSAEIRNNIYAFTLTDRCARNLSRSHQPALARSCRQIRQECFLLFYASNTFSVRIDENIGNLLEWLENQGRVKLKFALRLNVHVHLQCAEAESYFDNYLDGNRAKIITDERWVNLCKALATVVTDPSRVHWYDHASYDAYDASGIQREHTTFAKQLKATLEKVTKEQLERAEDRSE